MTVPALRVTSDSVTTIEADVLVLGVQKTDAGPRLLSDDPAHAAIGSILEAIGFSGGQDELRRLPPTEGAAASIALVGIGTSLSPNDLRYASGSATRQLRGVATIALALPIASETELLAVLEGAAIGAYSYDEYRGVGADRSKGPATGIIVASTLENNETTAARAAIIATAIHTVRDLVNAPPLDFFPETFAVAAESLGESALVEVEVLREAELLEGGFGGILGVGQGSTRGPRLVKVSYSPPEATRHIALVGKGITFDSGGLSLKPPAGMVGMKYDMAGAAVVLAVVLAVARLGLNVRLTGWLCIAENMPSGSAIRPNDVLRIRGGKTVEVLNTDAEGRLVLADGIVAASEERPDAIIDVATLTGAQRVALGDRYSGVMGDDELVGKFVAQAVDSGELFWPMPLPAELRALLNSDVADIANAKIGNTAAGMLLAGVFLREFVGRTGDAPDSRLIPWAHLDIAGPSNNSGGGFGFTGKGPTAVGVRALIALAEEYSGA
jgi:leucyl aminopeptidase